MAIENIIMKHDTKRIAPLLTDFEFAIGKNELTDFFKTQPFQLSIDSKFGNCELCWKKSDKNLVEAIKFGTRFVDWHQQMESEYSNMFFRGNLSINDLVEMYNVTSDQFSMFDDTNGDNCVCQF